MNLNHLNHPSFVGFDRLFNELDRVHNAKQQVSYPPHNIVKISDTEYLLELALAGYRIEDLEVHLEKGVLTVRTAEGYNSAVDEEGIDFIYKGISAKKFRKSFTLSENIEVRGADLENGILTIKLEEVIPEEKRPKLIQIGGGSEPTLLTE